MSNEPKIVLPDEKSRWRCAHCGNLTRFDLTRASTVTEFWHADLAGVVTVEERNVGAEEVLAVSCRWCGASDRIEIVPRPEFGGPSQEAPGDGGV
jgi:RNase P subunit RPR2